ncbi:sugar ABC transporter permease [Streptomyces scabiei]|uniref:carbohydrate ABC transporter permease n=1 Tax=Streptomyces scabiei TaxID=1930 RepID=UPI001B30271A|nr:MULTISPECIES: sugar ABC transporter permease [Streptomyces]MBP5865801.1 sugar ABC transporter permease [Streptomyces sp. LBUM 1484]MBP5873485.1 sugar ABC transporter permease [Streptomyces sp. LBUM 1477]MBP5881169.1 sugar ABC transporter permease [Streptomyces sp. LBUM 1487]MBP5896933.1 sugar ABC transporter permease [Streptomyces sp. LBUM 1488]MDW8470557.1 sugar ABC transporter permease [Streptomyces scabiei]
MTVTPHQRLPDGGRPPGARPAPRRRRAPTTAPWWFALPAMLLFVFVVLVPSVRGVYYAFTDWDGLSPDFSFVGPDNFTEMLRDEDATRAIGHTLLIAVSITIAQNAVGLLLALGVNSVIKSRNVLRVFLFAPAVITPVVTAFLWRNLLGPDGAVNSLLGAVGLGGWRQDWLGSPTLALWSVVGVIVWQFAGYSMVIFLAGLQSVPKEVHEAAAMDGAGPVRRLWSVTRPLLAPALTINLMLSIIGGIKLFDQVWALTGGGPGHATDTISTLIYKDAFTLGEFGYSIALAVVLTIIVAVVSSGQYLALSRNERAAS